MVEPASALIAKPALRHRADIVGVPRGGRDREPGYPGGSALIDPMGVTVIASLLNLCVCRCIDGKSPVCDLFG
jgi:predicted amidohydrolase